MMNESTQQVLTASTKRQKKRVHMAGEVVGAPLRVAAWCACVQILTTWSVDISEAPLHQSSCL